MAKLRRELRPTSFAPYGNCVVLPPDSDQVMFRCNEDRRTWYLEHGLAIQESEDPPVLRLTFQPKGPGHAGDPYFLQEFKNRCVVCGNEENLSHHHIVPDCYRKHFPRESYELGRWMYDVLVLCVRCHGRYEERANELKDQIAEEYGVSPAGTVSLTVVELRAMKAAAALYRHGDKIPPEKRIPLEADVRAFLGPGDFSSSDLRAVWKGIRRSIKATPAGEIIVERTRDVDDFAVRWRRHFMTVMKPRFLPEGWDPERRIYSEPDQVSKS